MTGARTFLKRGRVQDDPGQWQEDQETYLPDDGLELDDAMADPFEDTPSEQPSYEETYQAEEDDYDFPAEDEDFSSKRGTSGQNLRNSGAGAAAIAGLVAVAILGGGGAVAWKAGLLSAGSADSNGVPPVIQANKEPSKVVPPPVTPSASVAPNDTASEKIVSRAEEPVPVTVSSPANMPAPAPAARSVALPAPSRPLPLDLETQMDQGVDPAQQIRRVKTVKVMADGTLVTGEGPGHDMDMLDGAAPMASLPSLAPVPQPVAAPRSPLLPADPIQPVPEEDVMGVATPTSSAPVNQALPMRRPRLTDGQGAGDAVGTVSSPAANRSASRQAQVALATPVPSDSNAGLPPADVPSAPQRTAVGTPTPPSSGGFMVQIASTKSEAEAMSAFRALQQRYGGIIGPGKPSIRKADLGERGTFYRVRIGAGSLADATALCQRLKSAGADCVPVKN